MKALKKLISNFLILVLCFLVAFSNFLLTSAAQSNAANPNLIELSPITSDGNLFANMNNLLPGSVETQQIVVKNVGKKEFILFLAAKDTFTVDFNQNSKHKALSDEALSMIDLDLTLHDVSASGKVAPNGSKIYSGKANGAGSSKASGTGSSNVNSWSLLNNYVELGTIYPGQNAVILATISIPDKMDNRYKNLDIKFRWEFYASEFTIIENDDSDNKQKDKPDEDSKQFIPENPKFSTKDTQITILNDGNLISKLPKTGSVKYNNSIYIISTALIILSFSVILFGKNKKGRNLVLGEKNNSNIIEGDKKND